jgi:MHS family proline/betaine transporter-like MFS transporter
MDTSLNAPAEHKTGWELMKVIFASSLGTLIEWYDFYIYGALAPIIAKQFFPSENPTAAFLAALATFAAGFVVRPFGALVFGRLGDLIGRKYTFLLTLLLMGISTFGIGFVPSYASIGAAAPFIILALRFIQGLALGGEYGGAATYVAEHSPKGKRGYYTSYIQTTATLGLLLSLGVILITKKTAGDAAFNDWAWRVPFWVSIIMIIISVYIRLKMAESPLFSRIKREGKISANPLKESFTNKTNLKMVLLALFGAVMGQGVVWYTGQFYAQTFIERTCSVEFEQTRYIILAAIMLGTGGFILFGWMSDRVGRKWIMLGGMLLAILTYRPIYKAIYATAGIKDKTEVQEKAFSGEVSAPVAANGDSVVTKTILKGFTDGNTYKEVTKVTFAKDRTAKPKEEKTKTTWLSSGNFWILVFLVFLQILYVTMVYGPIAAFLVELFPTRIRYTSMSLPYHIGNGIFGGLTPLIATRLFDVSKTADAPAGDPFVGLWYPIVIAAVCMVIGALYMPNKAAESNEQD